MLAKVAGAVHYATQLPNNVTVAVTDGKITSVTGLSQTAYEITKDKKKVDLALPYQIELGMQMVTAGNIADTITVTPNVNYTTAEARYNIKLRAGGLSSVPLLQDTDTTLRYEITLGTGKNEHPTFGRSIVGLGTKRWDQNVDSHKKYRDDDVDAGGE